MSDEMRDRIERLQLYERGEEGARSDAIEYRQSMIDRWGEDTVRKIEDLLLNPDGPDGASTVGSDSITVETRGDLPPRRQLKTLASSGRWTFTGETFSFRAPSACPNAVFAETQQWENPQSMFDRVAWVDVCTTPNSWVRLMISPFDNPPGRSLFNGLAPTSIDRIRQGIRDGDDIPAGYLELEQRNVRGFGNVLDPKGQEGRNRGVAAFLEDRDRVLGRLITRD